MATNRRVVPREEWGAQYGDGTDVSHLLPWRVIYVHTEAGALRPADWTDLAGAAAELAAWAASATEVAKVRAVERFHAVTRGWDGIAYSFFIAHDGTIFEGRGWGRSGAHTEGNNSTAAGFCFQGHGDVQHPTPAQWAAARWLIGEGIRLGHLAPNPAIFPHRKASKKGKTCPGLLVTDKDLDRLRGIHGPTAHEQEELDVTITEARLRQIIAEEVQKECDGLREGILVAVDEARDQHGAVVGWLLAFAEAGATKLGTGAKRLADRAGHLNPRRKK